jgi:AAA15 family ATPase/GTPase
MRLIIQNFGPIKQGEIDLTKKFYMFVGYNNTGKTYVSQLLWSLFNEDTIENFSNNVNIPELHFEAIGKDHFEITPQILDKILGEFALFLKQVILPKIFNVDRDYFVENNLFLNFKYDINQVKHHEFKAVAGIKTNKKNQDIFTISKEKNSLLVKYSGQKLPDEFWNAIPQEHLPHLNQKISSIQIEAFYSFLVNLLLNDICKPFFLPASRSFYPIFYAYIFRLQHEKEKEKADKLSQMFLKFLDKKENGTELELESSLLLSHSSDYTEPMNVLFDKLYRLNENQAAQNHYEHLVSKMINILGGDIVISQNEGIAPITFGFKPAKHDNHLPMFLSSSAVNQLNTLYLYFKYWAHQNNNFLMIDEPEENLHPKNQIALLNVLLSFTQANKNRTLITTHSPLLADAVNNYLNLFWLKEHVEEPVEINQFVENDYPDIDSDINLTTNDIAIYFFEGSKIVPYQPGDYGVLFSDFNYELRKINKINLTLTEKMYQLRHGDEED